jgi:hypothetical protein
LNFDPHEAAREIELCHPDRGLAGCSRFFLNHLKIKDKDTNAIAPFIPWECQYPLLDMLIQGAWVIVLKARQIGITWTIGGFLLWRMLYSRFFTAVCINQSVPYAVEFVDDKWKFMYGELPDYFRIPLTHETKQIVKIGKFEAMPYSLDSNLHALAGNENTARSFTANFALFDEATRIESFGECLMAAEPGLKNCGGQCAVVSSSRGPKGTYYKIWEMLFKSADIDVETVTVDNAKLYRHRKWTGVFFPWNAHPGRTLEWYEQEKEDHAYDPDYMRREFPETPQEAFEAAGGRVFPNFRRKMWPEGHLHHFEPADLSPRWPRYRGIDWGETVSAFVCLWVVEIPSDRPMLTIDPSCENLIGEMLAYSYKEDVPDEVEEKYDHGPDALRYIVASYGLMAWVHVYRELYVYEAVAKGHTSQTLCAMIKRMSGWTDEEVKQDGPEHIVWSPEHGGIQIEEFEATVHDRARAIMTNELADFGIDSHGHRPPPGEKLDKKEERREGRIMVNRLVVGAMPNVSEHKKTPEELEKERLERTDILRRAGVRTAQAYDRSELSARTRRRRIYRRRRVQRRMR